MTLLLSLLLLVPADTLDLAALQAAAEAQDPRAVQPELLARAARLRIEAIRAGRLPQLAVSGQATLQSDVPTIPVRLPDGTSPSAPREQARLQLEADWAVLDGGRAARSAALEEARLAEQTAAVAVALYPLREAATETFFGVLLLDAQVATLALAADDLEARLAVLRRRAAEGAALDADADAVEATLLGVRQQVAEAEADRRAARTVLADLTGVAIGPETVLAVPDPDLPASVLVAETSDMGDGRPELARFAATERRAEAEARLAEAATAPTVSVFGQAGVGRPNPFDFLSDDLSEYAQVGVRLRWAPVDWGRSRRQAEAARLQAAVARADAEAFARRLLRDTEDEMAQMDRLRAAVATDDRIVALREEALRVARRQLEEGVLLPDAYTDRVTDLAQARLDRDRRRLEWARARARVLVTLGHAPTDR